LGSSSVITPLHVPGIYWKMTFFNVEKICVIGFIPEDGHLNLHI